MRLQRFLARTGVASRRKAEELIRSGQVTVGGRRVTDPAAEVPKGAQVKVRGRGVSLQEPLTIVLHKPSGTVTTTRDPEGRRTVLHLVGAHGRGTRLFPVGRLDYHTQGVLLLTNDGDLMQELLHPSRRVERVYHAKLDGRVHPRLVERLRSGVRLGDGPARADRARVLGQTGKHTWVEIVLHEGRNRMVHRMAQALGHRVLKLARVRFAGLEVGELRPGEWRPLSRRELLRLRQTAAQGARQPGRAAGRSTR